MAEKDTEGQNSCGFLVDGRASIDAGEGENTEPWMQYPLGDSLDRNYYSDLLGGIPITATVQSAGDSISGAFSCDYPAAAGGGLEVDYSRLQNNGGSGGRVEVQFSCDAAATSSSGGSLGSPGKSGREGQSSKNKMQTDMEDMECQSEEAHEESGDNSKQPSTAGTSSSKRSRAAQVHNLSEKRRRNRINEKMKALQNLIPNSNKTDKASMLDEAIDYLKQLQLQVQMLSARNGIDASPMHMLSALPHVQMPQTCMSPGHAGMALNMGRRTGLLNITQGTAGQTLLSVPDSYTGGLHPMPIPYASTGGVDVNGSMQGSCEMDDCSRGHLSLPQVPTTSQEIYTAFFSQRQ